MVAGQYIFRPDALLHGSEQDHLEVAAADRVLGPGIAGGKAARLGPDQLAVFVMVAQFRRLDRSGSQYVAEAELDKFTHGVRLQIDADAERLNVGNRLVDPRFDAGGVKAE